MQQQDLKDHEEKATGDNSGSSDIEVLAGKGSKTERKLKERARSAERLTQ